MLPIVLIGRASCWKEDFNNLLEIIDDFDVMAIGLNCQYSGDIQYFATYHIAEIATYKRKRKELNVNLDFKAIGHLKKPEVDIVESHKEPSGSSALLGSVAAIRLGYKKIVLVGCPLEGNNSTKGMATYNTYQRGWVNRKKEVNEFVKSMSGWTSSFLGKPTKEWINGI